MTARSVPSALRETLRLWKEAGCPGDDPTRWSPERWGEDLIPATLGREPIRRADVVALAEKVTAEDRAAHRDAFVAAMIWGYGRVGYGPSRVRRIMAEEGFADQLAELTCVTLEEGGPAAFARVWERRKSGTRFLRHLGGAFGTKYIYVLTKAHPQQRIAPILDSVVRAWFAEHAPTVDVQIGDGWTYPHRYATYVETLQAWGDELGLPADDVERLIFLQREGQTGGTWQEDWLSSTPISGPQDLLRMLADRIAELGLEEQAETHLEALADLLASTEDAAS